MKILLLSVTLFISIYNFAQVGINTETPKATLDVTGSPTIITKLDGVIAPRITGEQLRLKNYTIDQVGAIVYVTTAALTPLDNQVVKVSESGYYYFDGSIWQLMSSPSSGSYIEPWNEATTTNPAISNTQNIYQTGNVGIGNDDPQNALHVTAAANPVRFEGLQTGTEADNMVVADNTGVLRTIAIPEEQVLRFGVNGKTAGTSYVFNQISAMRFDKYDSFGELGVQAFVNGGEDFYYNFVNTISGSVITEGVTLPSFTTLTDENTVPATRTTDVVTLPSGIYEVTFDVRGLVDATTNPNLNTKLRILTSVNNSYFRKTYSSTGGNAEAENTSSFIMYLNNTSDVDFLIEPFSGNSALSPNTFTVQDFVNMGYNGCGNLKGLMQSEIVIKRISSWFPANNCSAKIVPKK